MPRQPTAAHSPLAAFTHVFLFKFALRAPSAAHPRLSDTSPAQEQLTGQHNTCQKHSGLVGTPHVIIVGAIVARDPARAEVDPHAAVWQVWALLQNLPQRCAIVGNACAWLQGRLAVLQGQLRRLQNGHSAAPPQPAARRRRSFLLCAHRLLADQRAVTGALTGHGAKRSAPQQAAIARTM